MEMFKSIISKEGEKYYLELYLKDKTLKISITEDKPNEVKSVFNDLIVMLKKEEFNFKFEKTDSGLYDDICNEYIKQLNIELKSVRKELVNYDLIDK